MRTVGALVLFSLLSLPAFAQAPATPLVWTAVASTGTIDESALDFFSFGTTNLGYLGGSPSTLPIVARYNVTNLAGGGANPLWNTLELGYLDPNSGGQVTATLYRVNPCTGSRIPLCTVTSVDNSTGSTCRSCSFTAGVNFQAFLYYVEVTLTRLTPSASPQANTLRIF
jgi:hypothetical protein